MRRSTRSRIWYAKCGVDGPIRASMSCVVGSRIRGELSCDAPTASRRSRTANASGRSTIGRCPQPGR